MNKQKLQIIYLSLNGGHAMLGLAIAAVVQLFSTEPLFTKDDRLHYRLVSVIAAQTMHARALERHGVAGTVEENCQAFVSRLWPIMLERIKDIPDKATRSYISSHMTDKQRESFELILATLHEGIAL